MELKEYSKMSKETGKTIIIMVRNDLAANSFIETKKIQTVGLGDCIVQSLDESIKDEEK